MLKRTDKIIIGYLKKKKKRTKVYTLFLCIAEKYFGSILMFVEVAF